MSHKLVSCILMAGLITLVAVGCTITENEPGSLPAESPSPTTEEARLDLAELSQIHSISIQYDNYCGPNSSRVDLQLAGDHFVGTTLASIKENNWGPISSTVTETITVPIEVVNSFLETLAGTSLEKGTRRVVPTVPDSCPFVAIELSSNEWLYRFSSDSPNQDRVPWSVTIIAKGDVDHIDRYVTESALPARALDLLNQYLRDL